MYILIRVPESHVWQALIAYLRRKKIWFKEFKEPEYQVVVTAEERSKVPGRGNLNPPRAWETCAHLKRVTHWDNLGRGPWRDGNGVAGECAAPEKLNHISCPMHCTRYEPGNLEAHAFLVEAVIQEYARRIDLLRQGLAALRSADDFHRLTVSTGVTPVYKDGRFVIPIQQV